MPRWRRAGGRWSEGFDTPDSWQTIPDGFAGVIWTNRIDRIGPAMHRAQSRP
jgi:glycerophosphoryl diester phosphodiesterase